jgi:hypothetical protein
MKKQSNNDPSRIRYQKMLAGKLFVYRNEQYLNLPFDISGIRANGAQLYVGYSLVTFDAISKIRSRYYTEARILLPVKDFQGNEVYHYTTSRCSDLAGYLTNGTLELYDENKHKVLGAFTHRKSFNPRTSKDEYIPVDAEAITAAYAKWQAKYDEETQKKKTNSYSGNMLLLGNAFNTSNADVSAILNTLLTNQQTPKPV